MTRFALRYPYFIIVSCLMPRSSSASPASFDCRWILFPEIKMPVVIVATFYPGMPPEQIEQDLTSRLERFLTLASGIDHMESRSLPGASLIKIYFQPGTSADSAVSSMGNLAHGGAATTATRHAAAGGAEVRRLQPARVPHHAERRRHERSPTARCGPLQGAHAGRRGARCRAAAADGRTLRQIRSMSIR
jgi:hypothetical protein